MRDRKENTLVIWLLTTEWMFGPGNRCLRGGLPYFVGYPRIHETHTELRTTRQMPVNVSSSRRRRLTVLEMVLKYAHLASDHLAPYVERMSGLRLLPVFPDKRGVRASQRPTTVH